MARSRRRRFRFITLPRPRAVDPKQTRALHSRGRRRRPRPCGGSCASRGPNGGFSPGASRVLEDVSLRLDAGEVVAVVGPSGAGKSTLAALIARLYDPDQGRVRVVGATSASSTCRSYAAGSAPSRRSPSSSRPASPRTSATGVRPPPPDEVRAAARTANAAGFVERFPDGYDTLVGERGVQLSGGRKQRVAIARAVLKDPRILVERQFVAA